MKVLQINMESTLGILTKENAYFFMEMVDSVFSPNFVPEFYKTKPYKILLRNKNPDYERFIGIYKLMNYVLSEREIFVLDSLYGVKTRKATIRETAKILNLSTTRVGNIRADAERKIVQELKWYFNI